MNLRPLDVHAGEFAKRITDSWFIKNGLKTRPSLHDYYGDDFFLYAVMDRGHHVGLVAIRFADGAIVHALGTIKSIRTGRTVLEEIKRLARDRGCSYIETAVRDDSPVSKITVGYGFIRLAKFKVNGYTYNQMRLTL